MIDHKESREYKEKCDEVLLKRSRTKRLHKPITPKMTMEELEEFINSTIRSSSTSSL